MDLDTDVSCTSDEEADMQNIMRLKSVVADDRAISAWSGAYSDFTAPEHDSTTNLKPLSIVSKIEVALGLNKLQEEKLARLEKIFAGRLQECREKLANIQHVCVKTPNKEDTFNIFHCGKPYFKDAKFIRAPDNEDTIAMRNLGMYDFSGISSAPGWTVTDKNDFCKVMLKMSKAIKREQLQSLLNQYNREAETKDGIKNPLQKKIDVALSEFKQLDKRDLSQLAMPVDYEYDWEAVAKQLGNRHSAMEYRGLWRVFLHPTINKSSWTQEETHRLQLIAQANNLHNWDKIARELNTGRSQYQCFVYYRTNMVNSSMGKKWTPEEEEYLRRLVEHYRQGSYIPWAKIAPKMQDRTKLQIYNKYIRLQNKKGRFLPEEDAVLLTCVKKYGTDFRRILKYLNGRSLHQVKIRYRVLVNNANRISSVWTVEEDRKLIQLMANQDAGSNYSNIVKHFPGKDRTSIRTRYITLMKWMKHHPKKSIENAPRRGARRLPHGREATDLTDALATLKKRMENEFITQRKERITEKSSVEVIDDAITVALVNELNYEEHVSSLQALDLDNQTSATNTNSPGPSTKSSTNNLHKLLLLLGSQMDKCKFEQNVTLAPRFSSLMTDDEEVLQAQPPKFKSYSKKNNMETVKNEKLSIWGSDHKLEAKEYALPPHFATIIGCKKLVAYGNSHTTFNFTRDISKFKKNPMFKEHWMRFLDRFHLLFIWPMLLSNGPPTESNRRTHVHFGSHGEHPSWEQMCIGRQYDTVTTPKTLKNLQKYNSEKRKSNKKIDEDIIQEDNRRNSGELKY